MSNKSKIDYLMNKKVNTLLYGGLFSGLGFFSYLLLVNNTNLPLSTAGALLTTGAVLFFILAFNIIGFTIIHLSSWVNRQYPVYLTKQKRAITLFFLMALMLLLLNYGLLTVAKLLAGAKNPFTFQNGGIQILILVWLIELLILSLLIANKSILESMKLQKESAALQQQNNIARYVALQNQLNPHFLFNSLNTLIAEIAYDPKNAVNFTRNLSDVYRYVLQSQNKILISLDEELTFMQSYIFLHQVRLGNCIEIVNKIPDNLRECKLPPLTLQLLAENVIKHNSITANKPMTIKMEIEGSRLIMTNNVNPKINKTISGTGLKNLYDRYMLITNKEVETSNTDGLFTVKIPLIYE